jgi:hypothetical protein
MTLSSGGDDVSSSTCVSQQKQLGSSILDKPVYHGISSQLRSNSKVRVTENAFPRFIAGIFEER